MNRSCNTVQNYVISHPEERYSSRKTHSYYDLEKDLNEFSYDNTGLLSNTLSEIIDIVSQSRLMVRTIWRYFLYLFDSKLIADKEVSQVIEVISAKTLIEDSRKNMIDKKTFVNYLKDKGVHYFRRTYENGRVRLIYIQTDDNEMLDYLDEFWHSFPNFQSGMTNFFAEFTDSRGDAQSVSFQSFENQINYWKEKNRSEEIRYTILFYRFLYHKKDVDIFHDNSLPNRIILNNNLTNHLVNGYDLVVYTPYGEPTSSDKFLLSYDNDSVTNEYHSLHGLLTCDFTPVANKQLREYLKLFLWKGSATLPVRARETKKVRNCLIQLSQELRYNELQFTYFEMNVLKGGILMNDTKFTASGKIYAIRKFLTFLRDEEILDIDDAVIKTMTYSVNPGAWNQRATSSINLNKFMNAMKAYMDEEGNSTKVSYKLSALVISMLLETNLRISQILALQTDSIRQDLYKDNRYILCSKTKTSGNDEVEQLIPIQIKRQLDEAIKITAAYRKDAPQELKKNIFIYELHHNLSLLGAPQINEFIKIIAEKCDIKPFTVANLRDTFMTLARENSIHKGRSPEEISVLTGHKSETTDIRHYVDPDYRYMLESTNKIVLDGKDAPGSVTTESFPQTEEVSNRCGFCTQQNCVNKTTIGCMACTSFVTTIDRKPYFEEYLKILNKKMQEAVYEHDRDDIRVIKCLAGRYLEMIHALEIQLKGHPTQTGK